MLATTHSPSIIHLLLGGNCRVASLGPRELAFVVYIFYRTLQVVFVSILEGVYLVSSCSQPRLNDSPVDRYVMHTNHVQDAVWWFSMLRAPAGLPSAYTCGGSQRNQHTRANTTCVYPH